MNCKICVVFVLCVVFVYGQSQGLTEDGRKCAKDGDYCQVHWDCCSNTCLTYLYKCTKTNNPLNLRPSTQLANRFNAQEPTMTLDQLITNIFHNAPAPQNNLENYYNVAPATTQPFSGPCKGIEAKCLQHNECCSNSCDSFWRRCVTRT